MSEMAYSIWATLLELLYVNNLINPKTPYSKKKKRKMAVFHVMASKFWELCF